MENMLLKRFFKYIIIGWLIWTYPRILKKKKYTHILWNTYNMLH